MGVNPPPENTQGGTMANTTDPITHCLERNWDMIESALAGHG